MANKMKICKQTIEKRSILSQIRAFSNVLIILAVCFKTAHKTLHSQLIHLPLHNSNLWEANSLLIARAPKTLPLLKDA